MKPTPILLFFAFCCLFTKLSAQQDSFSINLPDVVISENRMEIPFSEVSRTINVITAEQLRNLPVVSVAEALNYIAGVDIRQRGAHGIQADVSIRGGTFDQVLILINGIKMADPQTGHHALNLPVDLENIERIEVLKGPGARIFGQNAFAGAINIVTKTPKEQFFKIQLQAGENQLGGVKVAASMPQSNFRQYFSFSKDFSQGYRYNTDYDINNFFYQNSFRFVNRELSVLAGYTERRFGANGFYANPQSADQFESIQTSLFAIQYEQRNRKWIVKPRFYWRRNQDEYIFVRSNPSIYRNLHVGNTTGVEVNSTYTNGWGVTGLGLDLNTVKLRSNNLGEQDRFVASAFLEHRFSWLGAKLDLTPGLSFNYYSDFDAVFLPGIDAGFNLTKAFKIFANAGLTYRVPTFTDLYYEDPANLGNPELEPESALTYEAGLKYFEKGLRLQASYFIRQGRDLIDWTRADASQPWQPLNFNNLDFSGLDCSAELQFPGFAGNDFPVRSIRLGYTYLQADILENEFPTSRYALNHLRHQLTGGIDLKILKSLFLNVQARYAERIELEDYTLVDARLSWRNEKIGAFLEATNVFDEKYTGANLVPMPERWLRGGLSFKFTALGK